MVLLCFFSACFLVLHALRHRYAEVNAVYLRALGPLLRPREVRGLPGAFWFLLGAAAAVVLFPRDVALQRLVTECANHVGDTTLAILWDGSQIERSKGCLAGPGRCGCRSQQSVYRTLDARSGSA